MKALLFDGITEGASDRFLSDELVEDLRAPLSGDDFVRHLGISAQKPRTVIEDDPWLDLAGSGGAAAHASTHYRCCLSALAEFAS